jgi:biofilm PGA synthesis N-glycosyltransferase PgaC
MRSLPSAFVYCNLLFPFLDLIFTLVFIPGIVLALFGYFWIVGPITLALIPMAMAMNYFMYRIGRRTFEQLGLRVRFNLSGFFIYSLFYSLIMQPVSLAGYIAEILNLRKSWGTK